MRRFIGRLGDGVVIESVVVVAVDGKPQHLYRLVGGPDDGRTFESLANVSEYVLRLSGDEIPY